LIRTTPVLQIFFLVQTALVLFSLRLCFVPIKNARRGNRLLLVNGLAIPLTFVISVLSYLAGMAQSFSATAHAEVSEKARIMASGISTMINLMWLWIPFALILGILFGVQVARQREAASSRVD
jgi:hypothetical protein